MYPIIGLFKNKKYILKLKCLKYKIFDHDFLVNDS